MFGFKAWREKQKEKRTRNGAKEMRETAEAAPAEKPTPKNANEIPQAEKQTKESQGQTNSAAPAPAERKKGIFDVRYAIEFRFLPEEIMKNWERWQQILVDDDGLYGYYKHIFRNNQMEWPYQPTDFSIEEMETAVKTRILICKMPKPERSPLCHRIYMIRKDDQQIYYLTLEESMNCVVLCGVGKNGDHINFGAVPCEEEQQGTGSFSDEAVLKRVLKIIGEDPESKMKQIYVTPSLPHEPLEEILSRPLSLKENQQHQAEYERGIRWADSVEQTASPSKAQDDEKVIIRDELLGFLMGVAESIQRTEHSEQAEADTGNSGKCAMALLVIVMHLYPKQDVWTMAQIRKCLEFFRYVEDNLKGEWEPQRNHPWLVRLKTLDHFIYGAEKKEWAEWQIQEAYDAVFYFLYGYDSAFTEGEERKKYWKDRITFWEQIRRVEQWYILDRRDGKNMDTLRKAIDEMNDLMERWLQRDCYTAGEMAERYIQLLAEDHFERRSREEGVIELESCSGAWKEIYRRLFPGKKIIYSRWKSCLARALWATAVKTASSSLEWRQLTLLEVRAFMELRIAIGYQPAATSILKEMMLHEIKAGTSGELAFQQMYLMGQGPEDFFSVYYCQATEYKRKNKTEDTLILYRMAHALIGDENSQRQIAEILKEHPELQSVMDEDLAAAAERKQIPWGIGRHMLEYWEDLKTAGQISEAQFERLTKPFMMEGSDGEKRYRTYTLPGYQNREDWSGMYNAIWEKNREKQENA